MDFLLRGALACLIVSSLSAGCGQEADSADPLAGAPVVAATPVATPAAVGAGAGFTSMPDFAGRLRGVDKAATIEWDGRVLRIRCVGRQFSVFANSRSVVVDGSPENVGRTLSFMQEEIFVSPELSDFILGKVNPSAVVEAVAAPIAPEPTPTPTPTPKPMVEVGGRVVPAGPDSRVDAQTTVASSVSDLMTSLSATASGVAPPVVIAESTPKPTPRPTPTPTPTPPPPRPELEVTPAPVLSGSRLDLLREQERELRPVNEAVRSESAIVMPLTAAGLKMVVLDPEAFAGRDDAAQEANVLTMRLCRDVASRLEARGVASVMTGQEGATTELSHRLRVVTDNRDKAQVLLSVRVALPMRGTTSGGGGVRVMTVNETADAGGLYDVDKERLAGAQTYRALTGRNVALARALSGELCPDAEANQRYVPVATYLAKRAPMANAVIEIGNLGNAAEAAQLRRDGYLEELADKIVAALVAYSASPAGKGGN